MLQYKKCSAFKHQDAWNELIDKSGQLTSKAVEVVGPINPGAVVRHVAFSSQTKIVEDVGQVVPLYFSLVGCLSLSINRGSAVLLVPEVANLLKFCEIRPWITPTTPRDCQITSAGDAALQVQVRVRATHLIQDNELTACHAVTFRPTAWSTQQKSRSHTMTVLPSDEQRLNQFQLAMTELSARIASRVVKESPKGKGTPKNEKTEWFWVDSVVRPLAADNLARGQPWYRGFVDLMTKMDVTGKKPLREKLIFEKKGLHAMIEKMQWQDQGESTVVRAIHEAMRRRYGQIASENKGKRVAMKKRWTGEYDRWRLAFAGAKTPDQFRRSLCDLFSRAGVNSVLQQEWQELLPLLADDRWQLTRDLALLGLASYVGSGAKEIDEVAIEPEDQTSE